MMCIQRRDQESSMDVHVYFIGQRKWQAGTYSTYMGRD